MKSLSLLFLLFVCSIAFSEQNGGGMGMNGMGMNGMGMNGMGMNGMGMNGMGMANTPQSQVMMYINMANQSMKANQKKDASTQLNQTATAVNESMKTAMKSLTDSLTASQKLLAAAAAPIPDVVISPALFPLVTGSTNTDKILQASAAALTSAYLAGSQVVIQPIVRPVAPGAVRAPVTESRSAPVYADVSAQPSASKRGVEADVLVAELSQSSHHIRARE